MEILEFENGYRWLSNFHPCTVHFDGLVFPSSEHAYQAAKTLDQKERSAFTGLLMGPAEAKRAGKRVTKRADWDEVKLSVMYCVVWDKFFRNPDLALQLLATGEQHLEEGNYWGDRFWGTVGRKGENHLGKILMQVRQNVREVLELGLKATLDRAMEHDKKVNECLNSFSG